MCDLPSWVVFVCWVLILHNSYLYIRNKCSKPGVSILFEFIHASPRPVAGTLGSVPHTVPILDDMEKSKEAHVLLLANTTHWRVPLKQVYCCWQNIGSIRGTENVSTLLLLTVNYYVQSMCHTTWSTRHSIVAAPTAPVPDSICLSQLKSTCCTTLNKWFLSDVNTTQMLHCRIKTYIEVGKVTIYISREVKKVIVS